MTLYQPDRLLIGGMMLYMGAIFSGPAAFVFVQQKFQGTLREKSAFVHVLLCLITGLTHISYAFNPNDRSSSTTHTLDVLSVLLLLIACVVLLMLKDADKKSAAALGKQAQ